MITMYEQKQAPSIEPIERIPGCHYRQSPIPIPVLHLGLLYLALEGPPGEVCGDLVMPREYP